MDRRRSFCSQVLSILISFYLQDQYDQIAVHTQKGIDFLEKYGHFVDARSKIEAEYASKLRWEARSCLGDGDAVAWWLEIIFYLFTASHFGPQ